MKRAVKLLIALSLVLAMCLLLTAPALAAAQFQVGSRTYWVDGKPYQMDASPFVADGRTYVPVRYLALALGVAERDIGWDAASGTVTLKSGQTTVTLTVGKKTMYLNGQPKTMDVAPVVKNGRVYLPARWVAEALGYEAKWEAATKKIVLTPANRTEPSSPDPTIDGEKVAVYQYKGGVLVGVAGKYWQLSLPGEPRQLTITDYDTKQKRTATLRIPQLTVTDPDTGKKRTYDIASPDTWWGFPMGWGFPGTSAQRLANDPAAQKWIRDPVVVRYNLAKVIFGVIDSITKDAEDKELKRELELVKPLKPYTSPTYTPTVPYTPPTYSPVQPWGPGSRW